ncbi:helix-hairpin-helix domain-containing protein [Lentilactobacillus sp. SPB1-3]|uniref:Helix-hairpin-helix domain-containing protein n=1 Tax=Lentilactobacillus terminaliae TaxID=3003483 RepID=A0ACD5DDL4_9LACO|nr:helix-hairpin-helix domain-containing protein [Lentilactobacillus sp. SPB1-3]MCZ0977870.1 helix-hairpin-helix domain-containing protein [Lentilactobacillus sp. SPB1-3]
MDRIKELIEEYLYQVIGGMIIVCVGLMIGLFLALHSDNHQSAEHNSLTTDLNSQSSSTPSEPDQNQIVETSSESDQTTNVNHGDHKQIYVDVKGAVKNPGVYQVKSNMRMCDAVDLAGGFNSSADRKQVNLAKRLVDQQVVYIPIRGEIKGNQFKIGDGKTVTTDNSDEDEQSDVAENDNSDSNQVNLNTADKSKLQDLNGIGEKKADQILAYRQSHGKFKSIDEIKNVPGFGDKTFVNLKSSICV